MIVKKTFKYRLKPNSKQRAALAIQFGHARFVFNYALARRKEFYQLNGEGLNYYAQAEELKDLKREDETIWLKQADSQVLQQKLRDLDRAYINFFEGRAEYPAFKSKHNKQSIRYPQRFKLDGQSIYLPKVGWVKLILHRPLEGKMKSATVSKTKSGRYFVSIQCETEIDDPIYEGPHVGVDMGLNHFATLSTGEKIDNPRHLHKSEKRLARSQRELSRKVKGSANREKQRIKVARLHEKVSDQRRDFHHKLSRRLVDEFGIITFETLCIKGMVKNHSLAKSISDAGWGQFIRFTEYKGEWYGAYVEKIDRFYASTKTCSECGVKNQDLTLSDRTWVCQSCGVVHDRDVNAAINIQSQSTVGTTGTNVCGDHVRREPTYKESFARSMKQETRSSS